MKELWSAIIHLYHREDRRSSTIIPTNERSHPSIPQHPLAFFFLFLSGVGVNGDLFI